eukprot:8459694-Alexandrium_andersonii.AAC.1
MPRATSDHAVHKAAKTISLTMLRSRGRRVVSFFLQGRDSPGISTTVQAGPGRSRQRKAVQGSASHMPASGSTFCKKVK